MKSVVQMAVLAALMVVSVAQIVKTWVDADGVPQEQVFDITPVGVCWR